MNPLGKSVTGFLLVLFAMQHPGYADVSEGLLSYWSFDQIIGDTVTDLSGNNHHGTISGATPAAGIIGGALAFDGVDNQVVFDNVIGNFGGDDFSIAFWILTDPDRIEGVMGKRPICSFSSFFDFRINGIGSMGIELNHDFTDLNRNTFGSTSIIKDNV